MKKTLLEFYALIVCFVSMLFICGFLASGVFHVIQYYAPSALMMEQYVNISHFSSNDSYCLSNSSCLDDNRQRINEDQITKNRQIELEDNIESTRSNALSFMIWALVCLPVATFVFFVHWRLAKKARES